MVATGTSSSAQRGQTSTAAEANEIAAEFSVAYSVAQQYYAALAARESRSAAVTALAEADQNLRAAIGAHRRRRRDSFRFASLGDRRGQSAARRAHRRERPAERKRCPDSTGWHSVRRDRR